jgi:uncharacterized protein YecA (UPF0149 family)
MATQNQIEANRENASRSTGPRTESGKQSSSRNHLTLGLYTRQDYVKPEERDIYREFCETMYRELAPATLLEESLTSEITSASWRLRRCAAAEGELADYADHDPLLDESKEKTIRSLERARAAAHSILHRSVNQLRKLQAARIAQSEIGFELSGTQPSSAALAVPAPQLASNCKTPAAPEPPAPQTPRNAPCPCRSGEKFKRCCGRNAPPVLNRAA